MSVLEELKKKISDIETQSLAMEGCRPTFTVSEIMDLIDSVELAQNLHNACTDPIEREDVINILNDAMQGHSESEENLIGEIVSKVDLLPSAQPDHIADVSKKAERIAETAQNVSNDELISKKMAIEAINTWDKFGVDERGRLVRWHEGLELYVHLRDVLTAIVNLPSAQSERMKGEWADNNDIWMCNKCGKWIDILQGDADMNFCPNCGVDMRGEQG